MFEKFFTIFDSKELFEFESEENIGLTLKVTATLETQGRRGGGVERLVDPIPNFFGRA